MPRRFRLSTLVVLLLTAAALRAWTPDNMAIEHFDEGVYASNLFSAHLDHRYPSQHLYAPPFFPALLEWTLIAAGGAPQAALWVNVLLGTLLVWAVWWTTGELAGQIFGDRTAADSSAAKTAFVEAAALAAAAFVAFSDLFLQYSRAALTDIPVCLAITLAVGAGARGLKTGRPGWLALASVWTALGWWTKYNGWLPLAILGAGAGGWIVWTRQFAKQPSPGGRGAGRAAVPSVNRSAKDSGEYPSEVAVTGRWLLVAIAAFVLWAPCLSGLQPFGGYAAVARNHAGYVVGLSGWAPSAWKHLAVDRHYVSLIGLLGTACAIGLGLVRFTWKAEASPFSLRLRIGMGLGLLGALTAVQGTSGLMPALAALIALGIASSREQRPAATTGLGSLGFWILAAWLIGLTVTTPLYRPYPRLILPLLTGALIAAGISLAWLGEWLARGPSSREDVLVPAGGDANPVGRTRRRSLLIAIPLSLAALGGLSAIHAPPWQNRTGMVLAAESIVDWIGHDLPKRPASQLAEVDFVVYVLAEPGLYYHLAARTDGPLPFAVQPAWNLGMLDSGQADARTPIYLVTGPHSREQAGQLMRQRGRVRQINTIGQQASDLVLLDEFPPSALPDQRRQSLQLWVVERLGPARADSGNRAEWSAADGAPTHLRGR